MGRAHPRFGGEPVSATFFPNKYVVVTRYALPANAPSQPGYEIRSLMGDAPAGLNRGDLAALAAWIVAELAEPHAEDE